MEQTGQILQTPAPPGPCARVLFLGGMGSHAPQGQDGRPEGLFGEELAAFAAGHDLRCAALLPHPRGNAYGAPLGRLRSANVDLLSLAGAEGGETAAVTAALSGMDGVGLGETAALAYRPKVTMQNGVRLGFLSFGERGYRGEAAFDGVADILDPAVADRVRRLLPQCDHVIVFCHAGLPGGALPLPEWRARYRRFLDAGASLVIGYAPAAPMGWERHGRGLAFHNLGALSGGAEAHSLAVSVCFERNGRFTYETRALCQTAGGADFAPDGALLARLTEQNVLLGEEKRYLAEAARMCQTYFAAREGQLPLPAENGPLLSLNRGKAARFERREAERKLLMLLADESGRLAVLRALFAKEER